MAFQITARTLLELGAELISSDAIALYELVKNAVDAGSPTVRIYVQTVLPHSRYLQSLEVIDEKKLSIPSIRKNIEGWLNTDAPPGTRRQLLRNLDKVSGNREKFRAALIRSYHDFNFIEIHDDGEGMSLQELKEIYLTIGTRSRRKEKSNWDEKTKAPDRILLGDKGIGRLSVMRLGESLSVTTSKSGESNWNKLDIDWTRFSHDSDELLQDISIHPEKGEPKEDASISGTIIRITDLKSDWSRERFADLINTEFARMVDPFDRRFANRLFRIFYNDEQITLPQIAKRLFELAHAIVTFRFYYDDEGEARISGEMDYKLHANKKKPFEIKETNLLASTNSKTVNIIRGLGPFEVKFLWFNRKYLTALEGFGTRKDVLALVRQWTGGLMVFRDGFRINPYGGPDDDWLQLDKRAFARSGYKLNRQQIIGRVRLSWRNKFLVEQTNREGLVDNDYKDVFVKILQRILEDFKSFTQNIEDKLKREELTTLDVLKQRVLDAKTEVQKRVRQIAVDAPEQSGPLREVERLVNQLASHIDGVDEIVEDYKDERKKFVQLAGLGLMVELILHELGRTTGNTLGTLDSIDPKNLPSNLSPAFSTLETQLKTLQKRIETLDPLSASRRQVKESFTVLDLIEEIVGARSAQAARHGVDIQIEAEGDKQWCIKAVKGMFIQIIENLLANSFYWLKYQAVIHPDFKPKIHILIDSTSRVILVTDNGPGIEQERAEEIFEPFVTSKPPGQGNGLGLYIARELAEYNKGTLNVLSGHKHGQKHINTFILDFSGGGCEY